MKVYVIDPHAREIRTEEYDGKLESIYRLGGFDLFDTVRISYAGDVIYVDDTGLIRDPEMKSYFKIDTYLVPLAGTGVVIGSDEEGDDAPVSITLEELKSRVTWLTYNEAMGAMP